MGGLPDVRESRCVSGPGRAAPNSTINIGSGRRALELSSPAVRMATLKAALRPQLARLLWPIMRPARRWLERGRAGPRLQPGITAIVVARDEGYTLPFVLRSLVGFADQIVCIDNGSVDRTLSEMEVFKEKHRDEVSVEILSLPDKLVGELWEAGLHRTR